MENLRFDTQVRQVSTRVHGENAENFTSRHKYRLAKCPQNERGAEASLRALYRYYQATQL